MGPRYETVACTVGGVYTRLLAASFEAHHALHDGFAFLGDGILFRDTIGAVFAHLFAFAAHLHGLEFIHFVVAFAARRHARSSLICATLLRLGDSARDEVGPVLPFVERWKSGNTSEVIRGETTLMERRSGPRTLCDYSLTAIVDGHRHVCRAVDLSVGGLVFERSRSLVDRDLLQITPFELDVGRGRPIRLRARPIWTRERLTAVKFVAINDADRLTIAEYLDQKRALGDLLH